jgi:hypothetical protein
MLVVIDIQSYYSTSELKEIIKNVLEEYAAHSLLPHRQCQQHDEVGVHHEPGIVTITTTVCIISIFTIFGSTVDGKLNYERLVLFIRKLVLVLVV